MTTYTATKARADLYKIIDQTNTSHRPVTITGKRHNVVMISEEDWNAIQETLYLSGIPGMRDSIVKGLQTDIKDLDGNLEW